MVDTSLVHQINRAPLLACSGYLYGIFYIDNSNRKTTCIGGVAMKYLLFTPVIGLTLVLNSVWADAEALNNYNTLTMLDGDWMLSPAS